MTVGEFVRRVLAIRDPDQAQTFFNERVAKIRALAPEAPDPEAVVRSNIGWCFGEGMSVPCRQMWHAVCGAEHPVLGRGDRDYTAEELLQAGMDLAASGRHQLRPTAWQHLLRDD